MLQRSFSIVDDDDDEIDDDDNDNLIDNLLQSNEHSNEKPPPPPPITDLPTKITSAGPSGRQTVLKLRPSISNAPQILSSDSEEDSDEDKDLDKVPGEYDSKQYENLDVNDDIKEIFQYITKYIPQNISLDYKFRPFIPEFLPAVGDIDAFLKVIPSEKLPSGNKFDDNLRLGLMVLDEPATNQSDAAVLHLQLRANSVKITDQNIIVKKVTDLEKNSKTVDKWIKDISDLHKSKSSPMVRYQDIMPDVDDLMQQWPEEMEKKLKEEGFPKCDGKNLESYIDEVCSLFQIPTKNKFHALHLLFCLYTAVESSQLLQSTGKVPRNEENESKADQLVLE